MTIGVLIVDESAVARRALTKALATASDIEVLATAMDPSFAMAKMQRRWPDVVVLDIETKRMDGLAFLKKLMAQHPTPVLICSSRTEPGAAATAEAFAAGAVGVFTKQELGIAGDEVPAGSAEFVRSVRAAAGAQVRSFRPVTKGPPLSFSPSTLTLLAKKTERVVAIGTSTGGTTALEAVLPRLPRTCPGVVVVQHMPPVFTKAFADRLNGLCEVEVLEAQGGERVVPGRVLIAPGGRHLTITRRGAEYFAEVQLGAPVNRHCPSVDVLFRSVAQVAGPNAAGFIMTGMGDDGARGLKEMRDAGARTFAQDEDSCVIFGMPREAIELGAAEVVLSLADIPRRIVTF